MSKKIGPVVIIEVEKDRVCSMCGAKKECRPYGKDGADICFDCGMKNESETKRQMNHRLFGEPLGKGDGE